MRDSILRGLVLLGAVTLLMTEILSPFHLLRRVPLTLAWLLIATGAAAFLYRRRPRWKLPAIRPVEATISVGIAAIAAIVGLTAILSPPNSADAMAYHMPRVFYWVQSGSVAFFPTPYLNQIMLQPLAEYVMLHTYVLSAGDHFVNLVAFFAWLGSVIGVSALAGELGLGTKGQAFAALFCATLPNGILQASGAKNDSLLGLWLVAALYFTARREPEFMALAAALALATKATAYVFAPPMLAAVLLWTWMDDRRLPWRRMALCLTAAVLILNGPQYVRSLRLSGSPLGYDSAHGDGVFRWRNEHFGWKPTVSNALRNLSEQIGSPSQKWNQAVFDRVVAIHHALSIDPQDPDTTWRWARYEPPLNAKNHEANANNRWHLLLLAVAALLAPVLRRRWSIYAAALLVTFLLFCFYLKWQPFLSRLELPLFVMGSPLAAMFLESLKPQFLALVLCAFLVNNTKPSLFENWTRPLKGPRSLLATARDDNYFSDMAQWNNRPLYLEAVDLTARSGCREIGIDINQYTLEYPFQALLRERVPGVHFEHTGVENPSVRYQSPDAPKPCAVLCPDCAEIQKRIALYQDIGPPVAIGRFLLFLPRR